MRDYEETIKIVAVQRPQSVCNILASVSAGNPQHDNICPNLCKNADGKQDRFRIPVALVSYTGVLHYPAVDKVGCIDW